MSNQSNTSERWSRRRFLSSSASAGLVGLAHLQMPRPALAANNDTLKVGLIGCGGRGSGAAVQAMAADDNVCLTALGDIFEDRLQLSLSAIRKQSGDRVKVEPDHCFVGWDAYQKVIDSGVDVVLLATPPGFRPQHLKAAVDAGKHVFCEKPVAVDAPGVRSVLATADEARRKNLALVSGFCWRYSYPERAAFQKVHEGAIGDLVAVYTTYNTGPIWNRCCRPEWSEMEAQVRNWYYYTWLSGDHIVEQAVHSIDKMCWAMKDEPPLRAVAVGGRQVRTDPDFGHIFDHFSVTFDYPNGVKGFHMCRQQAGCANETRDYLLGSKGTCEIEGANRKRVISGAVNWSYDGPNNNMYQTEHDEMFESIRKGKPINDGVSMSRSTMVAILGRMAAYTGQSISWEQAFNSKEVLAPPKLEWGPAPTPSVALPGKTKFS